MNGLISGGGIIFVREQWHEGEGWYRLWSNGFCEQGGYTCDKGGSFKKNCSYVNLYQCKITLHKNFINSDYDVFVAAESSFASGGGICGYDYVVPSSQTNSSFNAICCRFTQSGMPTNAHYRRQYWEAKGFIS